MQITDADGAVVNIIDLNEAIKQVDLFSKYELSDDTFKKLSKDRQAYWTDMHRKLLKLQAEMTNEEI